MATLKQISDGLITKLAAVSGLSSGVVIAYPGSIAEVLASRALTPPFALVRLTGADYDNPGVVDNSINDERISAEIVLATMDLRGQGYSAEAGYTLLDAVLTAIQGAVLTYLVGATPTTLPGLEPVALGSWNQAEDDAGTGIVAYVIRVSTGQVRQ